LENDEKGLGATLLNCQDSTPVTSLQANPTPHSVERGPFKPKRVNAQVTWRFYQPPRAHRGPFVTTPFFRKESKKASLR